MAVESLIFIALLAVAPTSVKPRVSKSSPGKSSRGPARGGPSSRGPARGSPPNKKGQGPSLSQRARGGVKGGGNSGSSAADGLKNKAKQVGMGAAKGAAMGAITGGPGGALAGAASGGLGALKPSGKGAFNALKGKLGGGKSGQIPTQDLRASKEGNRGFLPEPKIPGLNKAKKQIPKEDLRKQPNATGELKNMKQKYDAFNKKMETLQKKVGAQVAEKMLGVPAPIAEKLIALGLKVEKVRRRVMIIALCAGASLLFLFFDSSTFDAPQQNGTPGTPTTTGTCNPAQFSGDSFGKKAVCTITINYAGSAQDISISDSIMPGTQFVSATNNGLPDPSQTTVLWDAQKDGLALNPVNIIVSVVLQVTTHKINLKIYNPYSINPTGLSGASNNGSTTIPGNLPPSTDNCSGIYSYYMGITPGHQNYGDPTCTLIKKDPNGAAIINKDAILSQLKTLKPSEAMGWFICVVPNESGYNANAYLGASTSGNGAYGLVQMNPSGKGNGQFDNGQVVWPLQLSNGINYNDKNIGHTFSYWPKSYDSCLNNYGVTVN